MISITLDLMQEVIEQALMRAGLAVEDAKACARIHAESTRNGVNSHGLDRIPGLVDYLSRGWVDPSDSAASRPVMPW